MKRPNAKQRWKYSSPPLRREFELGRERKIIRVSGGSSSMQVLCKRKFTGNKKYSREILQKKKTERSVTIDQSCVQSFEIYDHVYMHRYDRLSSCCLGCFCQNAVFWATFENKVRVRGNYINLSKGR